MEKSCSNLESFKILIKILHPKVGEKGAWGRILLEVLSKLRKVNRAKLDSMS